MRMDAFLRTAGLVLVGAGLLWGAAVFQGGRGASGRPAALAAAADRAGGAFSECVEGRLWLDFHVCVPAAVELLGAVRAQFMAGTLPPARRAEAVVRLQSAAEYLGRIFALCDLAGHEEACAAAAPVIRMYGGASAGAESAAPAAPPDVRPPRPGIAVPRL